MRVIKISWLLIIQLIIFFLIGCGTPNRLLESLVLYQSNNKWGLSDRSRNIIVKPKYDRIKRLRNGFTEGYYEGHRDLIDDKGKIVIESYTSRESIRQSNLYLTIVSRTGNQNTYLTYDWNSRLIQNVDLYASVYLPRGNNNDALLIVKTHTGKYGVGAFVGNKHNAHIELLLDTIYNNIYSDGGRKNKLFVESEPNKVRYLYEFREGKANEIKYEIINEYNMASSGPSVEFMEMEFSTFDTTAKYWCVSEVIDGKKSLLVKQSRATSHHSRATKIIDTLFVDHSSIKEMGIKSFDFKMTDPERKYIIITGKDGKKGVFDNRGTVILPMVYDEIYDHFLFDEQTKKNCFIVGKGDKRGVVDSGNNRIIDIEYDKIEPKIYYQSSLDKLENKVMFIVTQEKKGKMLKDNTGKDILPHYVKDVEETFNPDILGIKYEDRYAALINLKLIELDRHYFIGAYYHAYPDNMIMILVLDDDHQVLGYISEKGIKYFD